MAAPEYIDGVTASTIASSMATRVGMVQDGAQFGLEALRLQHQLNMGQFTAVAAAAQRTVDESGSGRARDLSINMPANPAKV